MTLPAGTRLGPYEVTAQIGAGGMGEVYRATDSNLKRLVAIKVLPTLMAGDADRLARFQREAEVLAALNHPNIAAIYGLEKTTQLTALVMELVEGEDLSAIIARSSPGSTGAGLQLSDTLPIARQIADALEAAHEQGIIHRDLKPQNIKVRADGAVKVLDFGLAKAMDPASSGGETLNSPTLTARATQMGVILGTAAYMAPEQAKGKSVDRRADIWAFGVVLHEMLTGRQLFLAETIPETLAHVMTRQVDLSTLPAMTPRRVCDLIARCLEKDPRKRLRDIGEARLILEDPALLALEAAPVSSPIAPARPAAPLRQRALPWAVAAAATLAALWQWSPWRSEVMPPETRLEIATPATDDPTAFAISPDGRLLAFVSAAGGQSQLWLRPLDQTTPRALAGTEGATYPFWSPDSRSVAFFAGAILKRLDIAGGLPQTLARAPIAVRGGTWNADGVILFGSTSGPLLRVSGETAPTEITKLATDQSSHLSPYFLPGGRQFLFFARGAANGLYLGSLDSPDIRRIASADTGAQFVAPDWVLFLRQGTLTAQRVDLGRGELTGEPVAVADQVAFDASRWTGAFSVSSAGAIFYRSGRSRESQLTWFDRAGKVVGTIGAPDAFALLQPMLSPDGRRVAAYRTTQGNIDVWLFDSGRETRLTSDPGRDLYPAWSSDGTRIVFSKDLKGQLALFQKSSLGGGAEELLLASSGNALAPHDWSADGRFLLYLERGPVTNSDLWVLPLDGKQTPSVVANTKFEERSSQFSPDGRWVAYSSDESGRSQIYLRPLPASSGQFPVSTSGGITPRWRQDGKELYYIAPDGTLMAVSIAAGTAGAPQLGPPVALFRPNIVFGGTMTVGINWQYDVAPDGRFLINVIVGDAVTAPITVIQHWQIKK